MKKHINFLAGQFFIWVVPIVCLVIMAFTGKTDGIKIKTWVCVAFVIAIFIYYIKGKKELGKVKDRQLLQDKYVHVWVRIIEYVVVMLPFVCILLILETIKTSIDEAIMFVAITMASITIGYILLVLDSKTKEKESGGE